MKRSTLILAAFLPALTATQALADAVTGPVQQQATNWHAIVMFGLFVLLTLGITAWAANRTLSNV